MRSVVKSTATVVEVASKPRGLLLIVSSSTTSIDAGTLPATEITTSVLAVIALFIAMQTYRNDRTAAATDIRQQWEAIHADWAFTVLLARGPDDYYSDATLEERQRLKSVIKNFGSDPGAVVDEINKLREYTRNVRNVARFFVYASHLVKIGRLSIEDAYSIFGAEISRHRSVVYWLSGQGLSDPILGFIHSTGNADWDQLLTQIPEMSFFGEQEDISLLFELLWAKTARRGDTYVHIIYMAARWLAQSGHAEKVRQSLRGVGYSPGALIRRWRFNRRLGHATAVRANIICNTWQGEVLLPEWFEQYSHKPMGSVRLRRRSIQRLIKQRPDRFEKIIS